MKILWQDVLVNVGLAALTIMLATWGHDALITYGVIAP
jgi:hypothetical protein